MDYQLTTGRLVLKPMTEDDIEDFVRYRRDPDVARWQSWTPDYSVDDARELVARQPDTLLPPPGGWVQLAVRSTIKGELIGDVGIHRLPDQPDTFEVGITFAPSWQGQGLATAALATALRFLFTEGAAHRVVAFCDARNAPVGRLLQRLGFRQESRQVEADYLKGEWTTLDGYAILAREARL